MILINEWNEVVANNIAEIASIFNPDAGEEMKIALFKNDLTPSRFTVFADLTLANFTGSTPKSCGAGQATVAINPLTGAWQIRVKEPAGGFEWMATDGVNLPQTIYGFAMLNLAGDGLIGIQRFTTPIELTGADQVVDVPQPIFELPVNPFS